jgi:hypothetical protein
MYICGGYPRRIPSSKHVRTCYIYLYMRRIRLANTLRHCFARQSWICRPAHGSSVTGVYPPRRIPSHSYTPWHEFMRTAISFCADLLGSRLRYGPLRHESGALAVGYQSASARSKSDADFALASEHGRLQVVILVIAMLLVLVPLEVLSMFVVV